MKKIIVSVITGIFLATSVWAAPLVLSSPDIDQKDMASIKRGAKFFAAQCMVCHTLKYMAYDPVAKEAGITLDKMPLNVKAWPFGITPPDLSLVVNVRGVDWVYTYLHSFYVDTTRPTGVNNLLVPNTAMSGILMPLQGKQVLVHDVGEALFYQGEHWFDRLELMEAGRLSPEQFDAETGDLVNFLAYASTPYYREQTQLGAWVLGFLMIFFIFARLLKNEYWRDVERLKQENQ